jgi:hypothetical protein
MRWAPKGVLPDRDAGADDELPTGCADTLHLASVSAGSNHIVANRERRTPES